METIVNSAKCLTTIETGMKSCYWLQITFHTYIQVLLQRKPFTHFRFVRVTWILDTFLLVKTLFHMVFPSWHAWNWNKPKWDNFNPNWYSQPLGEIFLLTLTPSIDRRLRQQNCGIILIFCWLLISPMYRKNTFWFKL